MLEFGRRQVRLAGRPVPETWVYLPLAVLAIFGALNGLEVFAAACRLGIGIPALLMSGLALWLSSATCTGQQRLGLRVAAASLWLAVAAIILSAADFFFPPAIDGQGAEFVASAHYFSRAVLALCALGAWTGLGIYGSKPCSADAGSPAFPFGRIMRRDCIVGRHRLCGDGRQWKRRGIARQTHRRCAGGAERAPPDAAPADSHSLRTWERIVAERRHMGLNFLKEAVLVVVCLVGAGYCINIGWCAFEAQKARRGPERNGRGVQNCPRCRRNCPRCRRNCPKSPLSLWERVRVRAAGREDFNYLNAFFILYVFGSFRSPQDP